MYYYIDTSSATEQTLYHLNSRPSGYGVWDYAMRIASDKHGGVYWFDDCHEEKVKQLQIPDVHIFQLPPNAHDLFTVS